MTHRALAGKFRVVRRRLLLTGGTTGLLWALVAVIAMLVTGAWLDLLWEFSPAWRIATLAAAGTAGILLVGLWIATTIFATGSPRVARRLDAAGDTGGDVLTGLELDESVHREGATPQASRLSAGLARMAVDRAADVALAVPNARAVPIRAIGRSAAVLTVAAAIVGLLFVFLPDLAQTQWDRFFHPRADVPPFSNIEFFVEPGDTEARYGSSVDVTVRVAGDAVEQLELVVEDVDGGTEVLPMFPESGDRWRAVLARVTVSSKYHARAHRARSQRYAIEVITVPVIEEVHFEVIPPDYAPQTAYSGPLPRDGIVGLVNSTVRVRAKSNRPLSAGRLTVTDHQRAIEIAMDEVGGAENREVSGSFTITGDGKFTLGLIDVAGEESLENFTGTITMLRDQRPFIRLLEPPPVSLATPVATVPVELEAEDDYGISRVELYRSLNDSRPLPMSVRLGTETLRKVREKVYLPLWQYGLRPGDTIKLFGRVVDNDPNVPGGKGAESTIVIVRIISEEDFAQMLRKRESFKAVLSKFTAAQRRMADLAEEVDGLRKKLDDLPDDAPLPAELKRQTERLLQRLRKESEAIRKSAELELPYDIDKNLREKLEALADKLDAGARRLESLTGGQVPLTKELAEELAKELERLAGELDANRKKLKKEANEPLEHLDLIYPLLADQQRFVRLVQRQKDLAERSAALKGHDGEDDPAIKARMRDLEDEQQRIRDDLAVLLDDIDSHIERVPDLPEFDQLVTSARDFVTAVRASGATEAMLDAEGALAEFAGTRAHEKATEAARILDSFLSKCKGMGDAAGGCLKFSPSLSQCLGNTIEQLLAEMQAGGGMGGMGSGMGGASSRQNSMNNVGLYGGMPGVDDSPGAASGRGDQQASESGSSSSGGQSGDDASASQMVTPGAAGVGQATVPRRYRQRAAKYLQRVIDEVQRR